MLPFMRSRNSKKKYNITAFGGVNTSYSRAINELSEGLNMTSELYPALSSAKTHETELTTTNTITGAGFFNSLYTIEEDTSNVYVKNLNTQTKIGTVTETAQDRTLAFMRDEMLIIPDNIIYNTSTASVQKGCVSETTTMESCEEKFSRESLTDDSMPMPYNTWYSAYLTSNSVMSMQKTYKTNSSTTYNFYHFSLSTDFSEGDVVTLKMAVKPIDATQDSHYFAYLEKMQNGITLKIKSLTTTKHYTPSGNITEITAITFDDNAIDMGGYSSVYVYEITVERYMPDLVDICSFENRMWGVTRNELCASKLGDCSEWNDFSVDDYGTLPSSCFKTEVETDGDFIAITHYNGYILAFKEDCIHKVYGNEPSEYTVTKMNCPGVAKESKDSLVVVGGSLYYKGKNGIYRLNGNTVQLISRNLSIEGFTSYCAGGDERFYYIGLTDGKTSLIYSYDTIYGIWHISSAPKKLKAFVKTNDSIKLICQNSILNMNSSPSNDWSFSYRFGTKEFASKHICTIAIRYSMNNDSKLKITLKNKHKSYPLSIVTGVSKEKMLLVRIPVSCSEDFTLEFIGRGNFTLSSLSIEYKETGIND